jgi:hypothetical protein
MRIRDHNYIDIIMIEKGVFELSIKIDSWELRQLVSDKSLASLKTQIEQVTGLTKIAETFDCTGTEAENIKDYWNALKTRVQCNSCKFKWKVCYDCVIKCDSPLEKDLLLELKKSKIDCVMQRRFNKDGSFYEFPQELDFDTLLTIPDFYIETDKEKLCIYADGHTYHERSEKDALRDRNIDRELQKLGFIVLRYTGKEIRSDCEAVVENIKGNM